MKCTSFHGALIAALLYAGGTPVAAGNFQSLESLKLQVEAHIMAYPYQSPYPPGVKLGNLDPRLRLKACGQALSVEFARPH